MMLLVLLVLSPTMASGAQKLLPDAMSDLSKDIASRVAKEKKTKIAVVPFRELGGQPTVLGTYLAEKLVTDLVNIGNLDLVERSTLDKVMGELKLNSSGAVDPGTAKQVGKLVGADAIITGTITEFQSFISLNCRLIDTQTGRIFAAAEARIAKDDDVKKAMTPMSSASGTSSGRDSAGNGSSSSSEVAAAMASVGETHRAGPLDVQFTGCRVKQGGLVCDALVTNREDDAQFCLYSVDYAEKMSRVVDKQGQVYTAEIIRFGEKQEQSMLVCTNLPQAVPVRAAMFFSKVPVDGVNLALVEFTFDFQRTARGDTWFKAQFRGATISRK
jgi:curli biogenesis system outer membrane secretion channel CsgG